MAEKERLYHTEGIVLKRSDLGEADRLLVLFTPGLGKLRVVAKGVRKVPSRKAGYVEPLMRSHFLLARARELDIVTQADAIEVYGELRHDLVRTSFACYLAELVDAFAEEGGENPALYTLLASALRHLADGDEPSLLTRHFELRLLDLVGYRPELRRCVSCGVAHEPGPAFFSNLDGGVRCRRCGAGTGTEMSLGAFKVMRYLQAQEYQAVRGLHLRPESLREVRFLLQRYLGSILERHLKSASFLCQVCEAESGL
ncbi:MAG: DNA repair protein RecO [Anaerolineae bacterium]